jgi:hypothetical protein
MIPNPWRLERRAAPRAGLLLLACLAVACPKPERVDSTESGIEDTGEILPVERLFSFVVLADPHLTGGAENRERAETAVAWVNAHAAEEGVDLVFVVGDIAWGGGFPDALATLGALEVPYVPILGDNEVQGLAEQAFEEAFASQWALLGETFDAWRKAPLPVANPVEGGESWLQNFSFDFRGLHFVGLDWCSRDVGSIFGEMADLHDFEGGTRPWFDEDLAALSPGPRERVVLLSHHPMHLSPGAFTLDEMDTLTRHYAGDADRIDADYAGHYHLTGDETLEEQGWDVHVTDTIHEAPVHLRLVEVWGNEQRFEFVQRLHDAATGS